MLHSTVRGKARLYQPGSDGRVLSVKNCSHRRSETRTRTGAYNFDPNTVGQPSYGRCPPGLEAGDHDPQPLVVRSIFVRFDTNATSDAISPSFGSLIQRTLDFASTASNHKSLIFL
jgi:hypothetical protein